MFLKVICAKEVKLKVLRNSIVLDATRFMTEGLEGQSKEVPIKPMVKKKMSLTDHN